MADDFDPTPTTDSLGRRMGDPDAGGRPEQDDGSVPGAASDRYPDGGLGAASGGVARDQGGTTVGSPGPHDQPAEGGRAEAEDGS